MEGLEGGVFLAFDWLARLGVRGSGGGKCEGGWREGMGIKRVCGRCLYIDLAD